AYIIYCLILFVTMLLVYLVNNLIIDKAVTLIQFITMLGLSLLTYIVIQNKKQIRIINNTIIIAIICSAIIGIGQFFHLDIALKINEVLLPAKTNILDGQRISGMSNTVIIFSYELIIGVTLILARLILYKNKRFERFWLIIGSLILLCALIMNQTRSAIIVTGINMFFILLIYAKNNKSTLKTIMLFSIIPISVILIGNYIIGVLDIYTRFQSNESSSARVPMVITGIKYALNNPFGTGNYNLVDSSVEINYSPSIKSIILENDTHNHLINFLVYYGFFGFMIAIKIYQIVISVFIKSMKNNIGNLGNVVYFLCIIGYSFNSMTHNWGIFNSDPLMWIIIAILFRSIYIYNEKEGEIHLSKGKSD
ncbi:O-antigen ligase family protein, partial [Neobacillus sp. NPDC058068]|uniref:O-antigen ligase family protein n=1 Tax=Neobacillus sp. NPDC058068 TaxID=3346325 RepID=UPI0036DC12A3